MLDPFDGAAAHLLPAAGCQLCGLAYDDPSFGELVIPDWAWACIAPKDGEGLLCVSCMLGALKSAGVTCPGALTAGPVSTVTPEALAHLMRPTDHERALLDLVASEHDGLDHEDERLKPFVDDRFKTTLEGRRVPDDDTFNVCHDKGWLRSAHNDLSDASTVRLTTAGRFITGAR